MQCVWEKKWNFKFKFNRLLNQMHKWSKKKIIYILVPTEWRKWSKVIQKKKKKEEAIKCDLHPFEVGKRYVIEECISVANRSSLLSSMFISKFYSQMSQMLRVPIKINIQRCNLRQCFLRIHVVPFLTVIIITLQCRRPIWKYRYVNYIPTKILTFWTLIIFLIYLLKYV